MKVYIKNKTTNRYFQRNIGSWLKSDEDLAFLKTLVVSSRDLSQPNDPNMIEWTDNPKNAPIYCLDNLEDAEAVQSVLTTVRHLYPNDVIEID